MTKLLTLYIGLLLCNLKCNQQAANTQLIEKKKGDFYSVVQQHKQLYNMSCIPSAVEMVLKYNKKVNSNYYELQNSWKEKADGTFQDFDNKTIYGLKFTRQFNLPRSNDFPIDSLFKTIDNEIVAGRIVIISLPSGQNMYHMYLLDHKTDTYLGYSRGYNQDEVLKLDNIKGFVKAMGGTDILTYLPVK